MDIGILPREIWLLIVEFIGVDKSVNPYSLYRTCKQFSWLNEYYYSFITREGYSSTTVDINGQLHGPQYDWNLPDSVFVGFVIYQNGLSEKSVIIYGRTYVTDEMICIDGQEYELECEYLYNNKKCACRYCSQMQVAGMWFRENDPDGFNKMKMITKIMIRNKWFIDNLTARALAEVKFSSDGFVEEPRYRN